LAKGVKAKLENSGYVVEMAFGPVLKECRMLNSGNSSFRFLEFE
jgi:hypothetical protein